MSNCNLVLTPLEANKKLSKDDAPQIWKNKQQMNLIPHAQAIGNLMHSSVSTRLDIFYTINSLAQFLSNPRFTHWQTLKCTMWYIEANLNMGLKYQHKKNGNLLYNFFDANWANDKDTWWSTSSY
jgi:hypothetical protein